MSCGGEFPLEVHGESFHQAALRSLVQSHRPEIVDDRIIATFMVGLMREPTNPYDADAVAVFSLTGEQLGHVPRELAGACSRALLSSQQHCSVGCKARAYGRRIEGGWNIGIWLALPDAEDLASVLAQAITGLTGATQGEVLAERQIDMP